MTQTITLNIWNKENKVAKKVEIDNVLSVRCESVFQTIGFFGDDIEILINPQYNNIEFTFTSDLSKVFIYITEAKRACED